MEVCGFVCVCVCVCVEQRLSRRVCEKGIQGQRMSREERTLVSNEWNLEEEVRKEEQCEVGKKVRKGQEEEK